MIKESAFVIFFYAEKHGGGGDVNPLVEWDRDMC